MFKGNLTKSLLVVGLLFWASVSAFGQGTAFTYQGKLTDNGNPANGQYDFQFKLFDTATVGTGNQFGSLVAVSNVTVTNGIFSVQLDFGACATCFNGAARFLEIAVKPTSGGSFTTLSPRQPITSAPYAINAAQLGGVAASGFLQNSTSQQAASNFNISGDGTAGGTLSAAFVNVNNYYSIAGLRAFTVNGPFNDGMGTVFTASNTFAGDGAGLNTNPDPTITNPNGKLNSYYGAGAGKANTFGHDNAFFGTQAGFRNTLGNQNAFFGAGAGQANTFGIGNAIFGQGAGQQNTTGGLNAFFGTQTGFRNTAGQSNTFVGCAADFNVPNPTGDNNTLLGAFSKVISGFSNATAIGFEAQVAQSNSLVLGSINFVNGATADTSVGIGTTTPAAVLDVQRDQNTIPETARFTTYGFGNEILSRSAGGTRAAPTATPNGRILLQLGATGHDGTDFSTTPRATIQMFAADAWSPSTQGTFMRFNTTASGTTTTSTRMFIADDGNVGIGTTAPAKHLHVAGASDQEVMIESTDSGGIKWTLQSSQGANNGRFEIIDRTANASRFSILSSGNVGVGTTAPLDKLHVNGIIRVATLGANDTTTTLCRNSSNQIATCNASSLRYKTDIQPFTGGLDIVKRLRPITFTWKQGGSRDVGFGAEDVAKVEPLFTFTNDKGEIEGVKYDRVSVVLINAVKQQQTQIEHQQEQIRTQRALIQQQQTITQRQEVQLAQQRAAIEKQQAEIDGLKRLVCASHPRAAVCKRHR